MIKRSDSGFTLLELLMCVVTVTLLWKGVNFVFFRGNPVNAVNSFTVQYGFKPKLCGDLKSAVEGYVLCTGNQMLSMSDGTTRTRVVEAFCPVKHKAPCTTNRDQ